MQLLTSFATFDQFCRLLDPLPLVIFLQNMEIDNTSNNNYDEDETIDLINNNTLLSRRNNIKSFIPIDIKTGINKKICASKSKSKKSYFKRYKKRFRTIYRRNCTTRNVLLLCIFLIILHFFHKTYFTLQKTRTIKFNKIPYNLTDVNENNIVKGEWCLRGPKDKECSCTNPSIPKDRLKIRHWGRAHHLNQDKAVSYQNKKLDVLFLGDSITEEWEGNRYGFPVEGKLEIIPIFQKLFRIRSGASLEGVPLGINADTSPNLLWRIQNGELPSKLNPSVVWLNIGTNDFGLTWCTPSITFLGIRKVIQYIRETKPHSTLVVNCLLPRTFHKQGYVNRIQYFKHGKYHNRPIGPNLWKDIQLVNTALKEYVIAENDENLKYFDVGDLFFIPGFKKDVDIRINQTLMLDYLHPTAVGHELWGEEIMTFVKDIISSKNNNSVR